MADDLYIALSKEIESYSKEVQEAVEEAAKEVADEIVTELKATSPKRRGKYAKGWAVRSESKPGSAVRYVVYNRTLGQLTHLLEFGHATRNGGRTRAFPHIGPAEQKAAQSFEDKLRGKL